MFIYAFLFEKPTGPERAQVTEYYMKTLVRNCSEYKLCKHIQKKTLFKKKSLEHWKTKLFYPFVLLSQA